MQRFLLMFRMMYKIILPGFAFVVIGGLSFLSKDWRPHAWRFLLCGLGLTACGVYLFRGIARDEEPSGPETEESDGR